MSRSTGQSQDVWGVELLDKLNYEVNLSLKTKEKITCLIYFDQLYTVGFWPWVSRCWMSRITGQIPPWNNSNIYWSLLNNAEDTGISQEPSHLPGLQLYDTPITGVFTQFSRRNLFTYQLFMLYSTSPFFFFFFVSFTRIKLTWSTLHFSPCY